MKEMIMKLKSNAVEVVQDNKIKMFKQGAFLALMFGVFSIFGVNANAQASNAVISAEMLKPITDSIAANLGVILPVGMGIMGTFIGIKLIPKLIYKFL